MNVFEQKASDRRYFVYSESTCSINYKPYDFGMNYIEIFFNGHDKSDNNVSSVSPAFNNRNIVFQES